MDLLICRPFYTYMTMHCGEFQITKRFMEHVAPRLGNVSCLSSPLGNEQGALTFNMCRAVLQGFDCCNVYIFLDGMCRRNGSNAARILCPFMHELENLEIVLPCSEVHKPSLAL